VEWIWSNPRADNKQRESRWQWLSDKIDADLEQDDTLTDEVVEQAEANWDASFAGMVTQIDIELTDDGIRQALTLGYLNSNSYCRPIIEQSMGVQPWS
jgi:broad specificity phosphatase PhoE